MKKPKKTTSPAKPRARRAGGITRSSRKATVKRVRKAAAERPRPAKIERGRETRAAIETPSAPERRVGAKASIGAALPAKPRRTAIEAGIKPKTAIKAEPPPPITVKPASLAELVAEARHASQEESVSPITWEAKEAVRAGRKAPSRIPPILLEGDKPTATPISGPGRRYALGPGALAENLRTEGELPESYGTGEILLTARDPHWLYSHWDLSDDEQRRYNGFSRDGHLIVRIYADAPSKRPHAEVHVHPESRHWFIHVDRANTRYVAELGYYSAADRWKVISTSCATLTPPDAVSPDTSAEFTAIPFEVPMQKLLSLVKEAVHENAPLAEALQELRKEGHPGLPQIEPPRYGGGDGFHRRARWQWTPGEWTAAQERALAEVVSMDHVRRVWMGSLEITELIRRQLIHQAALAPGGELGELAPGAPTSPSGAVTGISSPSGREAERPKGFWFNVNAELIVYGATERDATVTIGGRKIKLRADGSFSYRFALPDGNYEMPVVAISADGTDGRAAEMRFSRGTEYRGHVGAHPQDPALRQLLLENF